MQATRIVFGARLAWLALAFGCAGGAAQAAKTAIDLRYDGIYAGATMLRTELHVEQDVDSYLVRAGIETEGVWARLFRGRSDIVAQGGLAGNAAVPRHVDSEAYWNGVPHRLIVDYVAGVPVIRVMQPAATDRRRVLGRDDIAGTVDALGLVVGLIRGMAATGGCDTHARVFDGRGVTDFRMVTGAMVALPAAAAPYAGMARRCDFSTRKLAGLEPDDDARRIDHGYALFAAPAPGLAVLPVRIVFQTRWLGDAVLALTSAQAAPP